MSSLQHTAILSSIFMLAGTCHSFTATSNFQTPRASSSKVAFSSASIFARRPLHQQGTSLNAGGGAAAFPDDMEGPHNNNNNNARRDTNEDDDDDNFRMSQDDLYNGLEGIADSNALYSSNNFDNDAIGGGGAPSSRTRLERLQSESEAMSRFVHGDELFELRRNIEEMQEELREVHRRREDREKIEMMVEDIMDMKEQDAEYYYAMSLEKMEMAELQGDMEEMEFWESEAVIARGCLPQFNLEGLWVGKYGDHGYEMINVTYAGDTLMAYKITGDQNVPKGEITFSTDLSPRSTTIIAPQKQTSRPPLKPIELSPPSSEQWGTKFLPRFSGQGQVASSGFQNSQFVDGQLILVGDYFSFAWVPIGHQIFFGRPSAELTLKMMKGMNVGGEETVNDVEDVDDVDHMRTYAARCMEQTYMLMDDELDEIVDDEEEGDAPQVVKNIFFQDGAFE